MRYLLVMIGFLGLSACGETKRTQVSWYDSNSSANTAAFVVSIYSDLESQMTQSASPGQSGDGSLVYYYTSQPQKMKDCAFAQGLVAGRSGYHSNSVSLQACLELASVMTTTGLFPIPSTYASESGLDVKSGTTGYIYVFFFYGASSSSVGTSVEAGSSVPSNNRCFRLWAAEYQNGVLVNSSAVEQTQVNVNGLKCYGF